MTPAAPPSWSPLDEARAAVDAIALPDLLRDLRGDERNVVLTLARMWRTASDGAIVPKDEAAAWTTARLAPDDAALLDLAARAYRGEATDDWVPRAAAAATLAGHLHDAVLAALTTPSAGGSRAGGR